MALATCTAILAFLCLQAPIGETTTIKHEDGGVFIADAIQAKDWTLSTGQSMEWAPPKLDTAKLDKACSDEGCRLYWRHCDAAKCSFALATESGGSVFFEITAVDAEGLRQAMAHIAIELGSSPGPVIPLTAFDRESAQAQPPVIPPAGD